MANQEREKKDMEEAEGQEREMGKAVLMGP